MEIKYEDDVCKFYIENEACIFETNINDKSYKYQIAGNIYEPRIYFISMDNKIEFSVYNLWFPINTTEEWKIFCYKLIDSIKIYYKTL